MAKSSRQLIKDDYTTNQTLEEEARRLGIPLHFCWNKDRFNRPTKNGGYIINLADEGNEGTHWVALWKENRQCCYFDSFGLPPPLDVERYLPRYYYNATVVQNPSRGFCGGYCLEFLQLMNEQRQLPVPQRYQAYLNLFKQNFHKNHRILRKLQLD